MQTIRVGRAPDQPGAPEAVQLVALVAVHDSDTLPPYATDVGVTAKLSVGAGVLACTVTRAESLAEPPAPEQLSE